MKSKARPIIVKENPRNLATSKHQECAIDSTEAKLAAIRSKKRILEQANRTNNIYIVEEH